jgi:hypothetical protein
MRALAWSLIALLASGCSSWQAAHLDLSPPAAPGDTVAAGSPEPASVLPDHLRLHLKDGTEVTLEHPHVDGDSLRGINVPLREQPQTFSGRPEIPRLGRVPRAIALNDIRQVDSKRFDGVKSLFALVAFCGLLYVAALLAYGISLHGMSD